MTTYIKTILAAAIIALTIGLLFGGLVFIFATRITSMRIGAWITAATFVMVFFAQGAHDDRRD